MLYYVLFVLFIAFVGLFQCPTNDKTSTGLEAGWEIMVLGPAEVEFGLSNTASVTRLKIQVRLGSVFFGT